MKQGKRITIGDMRDLGAQFPDYPIVTKAIELDLAVIALTNRVRTLEDKLTRYDLCSSMDCGSDCVHDGNPDHLQKALAERRKATP